MALGSHCATIRGLEWVRGDPVEIPTPGTIIVAEFWATWCPPCRSSIPHLSELQKKYRTHGVTFVGITNEDKSAAERFVRAMGSKMEYTVAVDGQLSAYSTLMQRAGARGIPHAFIIDGEGVVRFSGHPMDPTFEPTLAKVVSAHNTRLRNEERQTLQGPPPTMHSRDELMVLPVKDLKRILQDGGIESAGIIDKDSLVSRIVEAEAERAARREREE